MRCHVVPCSPVFVEDLFPFAWWQHSIGQSLRRRRLEFVSALRVDLLPGKHGEIWWRLEVGWEKVACWSTKAAISLKRVKTDEKLLWRAYRNSPTLFRMVPPQTAYGLPFPRLGVRDPNPKLQSGTDCKFGRYIHRVHPNKKVH